MSGAPVAQRAGAALPGPGRRGRLGARRSLRRHRCGGPGRCAPARLGRRAALAAASSGSDRRILERRRPRAARRARSRCGSACWATAIDETIDLLSHDLDEGLVSAGAGLGMIRWTGDAPLERLRALRRAAAAREIPMTLERAPWALRRALGPFRRVPGRAWGRSSAGCATPSTRVSASAWRSKERTMTERRTRALDPCVHCGFCLPACPTYLVTGDEGRQPARPHRADARARAGGDGPDDPALLEHLDACLGCRGCEPVCPSGVGYGRGLEAAREQIFRARGLSPLARLVLGVFRHCDDLASAVRPGRAAPGDRFPPRSAGSGPAGLRDGHAGLDGGGGTGQRRSGTGAAAGEHVRRRRRCSACPADPPPRRPSSLFRGCVMNALFSHVHDATRRTLEVNGYRVIEAAGQACCGALHEHAGDRGRGPVAGGGATSRRSRAGPISSS